MSAHRATFNARQLYSPVYGLQPAMINWCSGYYGLFHTNESREYPGRFSKHWEARLLIRIESDPPLVIKRPEELLAVLQSGNSLGFIFSKKYKQKFKAQIERINKAETLRRKKKGITGDVVFFIYCVYVELINQVLTFKQAELKHALLVYTTSWRYISSYGGEDVGADKMRVTFNGKKQESSCS